MSECARSVVCVCELKVSPMSTFFNIKSYDGVLPYQCELSHHTRFAASISVYVSGFASSGSAIGYEAQSIILQHSSRRISRKIYGDIFVTSNRHSQCEPWIGTIDAAQGTKEHCIHGLALTADGKLSTASVPIQHCVHSMQASGLIEHTAAQCNLALVIVISDVYAQSCKLSAGLTCIPVLYKSQAIISEHILTALERQRISQPARTSRV